MTIRQSIRATVLPVLLSLGVVVFVALPANAQVKLSASDQQFVQDASQAGATEIAASKLALKNSTDPQIRKFAQQMVTDHMKLAHSLDVAASQKGLGAPPSADSALVGKLQSLKGADFDKVYVDEVAVGGHRKALELFQKESENGTDPQLKSAAAQALPVIRHHLAMAQQLADAKKASS